MPDRRRADSGCCSGGALYAKKARPGISQPCGSLLPRGSRHQPPRSAVRGLLRQASAQVRTTPRDLSLVCSEGHRILSCSDACLDQGEALSEGFAQDGICSVGGQYLQKRSAAVPFRRAPRIPRSIGLLSIAVRACRHSVYGWGGGVGDHLSLVGQWQRDYSTLGDPISAFTRTPLFSLHLLHGIQGEFWRIQGDGAGTIWGAQVRQTDLRSSSRLEGRWNVPAEHGLL